LYAVSLKFTKFVVAVKYGSQNVNARRALAAGWTRLLAGALVGALVAGGSVYLLAEGVVAGSVPIPEIGYSIRAPTAQVRSAISNSGLSNELAIVAVATLGALLTTLVALAYVLYTSIDLAAASRAPRRSMGDPTAIDVGALDVAGVRAAPDEAFSEMSEDEALADARAAMEAGDSEKAQAILDRFDEVQATVDADTAPEPWPGEWESAAEKSGARSASDSDTDLPDPEASDESGDSSAFSQTAAGMVDAFTEEETTEEDIGGYYYDIAFVLGSLRSKAFRLVALFMAVLGGTFYFLYQGGIGQIKADFLSRLPAGVAPTNVDVVALHPVEVLVFNVKISTLAAAVVTLPFFLYYAWPSLKERGFAGGDRRVLLVWAVTLVVGLVGGSLLGYAFVAPTVISWLAADAVGASMVIAYRISAAGWLVFFTTAGVGLLATVPLSMVLFHYGGLVSYRTMGSRWREVTLAVLAIVAYATPQGVFMMFIIGIPTMFVYGVGLGLLWIVTLGGRRRTGGRGQTAD